MGAQSRTRKSRYCNVCQQFYNYDAEELCNHLKLCARYKALGLIMPGIVEPGKNFQITYLDD